MFSKKTEDKLSEMADWKPPSQTPGEVLEEECQEYAETRRSLKKDVEELQEIIQAMMQENEKLPDTEKLELLEFNLDVDELQRLQELGEQEVAKVREEIELENLAKSYQRDVLKKKYWDSLSVKQKAIKAFHSGCEVENFPMNERTVKELEELSRVEAIREMEKADTSAPLEKDEKIKWLDVESLEFTGSLSAQYGGSNPHLYSQFDLHTRDQKMNQIILLQDVIYKVKTAFNTEFEAVYKQKEQEISRIRDRNKRIADIMSKLELQETLWEPTLSDNERPERALTVSDSEIKVEKYLTPEQRQREEEQRKEEEQRRLREKEDDSRARALDEMMGGILKVKKVDILKMEVPAPEFIVKPELEWTDEEKKSYKEYETQVKKLREEQTLYRQILEERIKKLQASINESTQAFDEILSKLYERKLKSEMAIYQAKLKIVNLLRSIIIEEEMLDREEELIYELEEARAIENEIRKRLNNHREDVEAFQETYDNTVAEDKLLDRRFRKEFCDVPRHIVDQLYKLYKRRPRIQIMRALTDKAGSLKESPVLSQAATEGLSQIMKAMEELDAPQNMPEGLDPAVWERFCLARRTKVESEQKVKMKALVLAEKLASLQKITDEEQNAKMEFNKLVDELNCLRVERSTLCSNVMVQLLLKQGQVEVENEDFAADYSDSLLLHRNVVEDLNSTIRALGKQKIASMVECKDLRKTIIQKEWEYKRMSMQIEDLRNKARDIQMLHLSREVLEYLTEPDSDFRISKKVSSMEKTIALEEKTHRKNVKNCKRMIKELNKQIEEKKEINAALELQLKNMQVTVAERRNIYEARAWEEIQERKAKQRCRNVLQRRKLVDLAKAQDMEIAALSTELKSVRMKTFPAFS
ncbi:cilia- and flagella-associated protein 43-like isoform X1 [Hemibagrus wyckioides]|uniref:cilia- and flagella-associated protein 43-like isoform X1 n=1 Tax=Hemibagrus wyckioides TaxID=337641 RepID=UPI00266CF484|nr:cilia- and flagella-associated protein 43-like isoform X1 [Hemibagrus wyckioides]